MVRIIPAALLHPSGVAGPVVAQGGALAQASEAFTAADTTLITALAKPWTKHAAGSSNTAAPAVAANRAFGENAATISLYYRDDWQPTAADYAVRGTVVMRSDNNASVLGVVGRLATAANTFYQARYTTVTNVWQLFKFVAGVGTQLGSDVAATLTVDQGYALELSMRGSQIVLAVDGVPLVTATDGAVTAPGRAGLRLNGAATSVTGLHLDDWSAVQ